MKNNITAHAFNSKKNKLIVGDAKGNTFHINEKGELLTKEQWADNTIKSIVIDENKEINYLADNEGNIWGIDNKGNKIFSNKKRLYI